MVLCLSPEYEIASVCLSNKHRDFAQIWIYKVSESGAQEKDKERKWKTLYTQQIFQKQYSGRGIIRSQSYT